MEPDPETKGAAETERRADRWLRAFAADSSLWAVGIAAAGVFVTTGAGVLLLAFRGRGPLVVVALLLLAGMTLETVLRDLRKRRFGPVSRAALGLWLASGGAALLAVWLGLA